MLLRAIPGTDVAHGAMCYMPSTDLAYAATASGTDAAIGTAGSVHPLRQHGAQLARWYRPGTIAPLGSYALGMRCPVLTYLRSYARAMLCDVRFATATMAWTPYSWRYHTPAQYRTSHRHAVSQYHTLSQYRTFHADTLAQYRTMTIPCPSTAHPPHHTLAPYCTSHPHAQF
eukprot:2510011-Rhodomonas_salina.3